MSLIVQIIQIRTLKRFRSCRKYRSGNYIYGNVYIIKWASDMWDAWKGIGLRLYQVER